MNRSAISGLKAGDNNLIADTTSNSGTRKKASLAFGLKDERPMKSGKLDHALRCYNQS
jgi:hypothetical protein